jgi:hypothetical protein
MEYAVTAVQPIAGAAGAAGAGALGTDVWASQANPGAVTDWGPPINTLLAGGAKLLNFGEHVFPYSTPIDLHGQAQHVVFQGAQGRGWYTGGVVEHVGTRLIWKGGASPATTGTDGAMTSGSATFTSAAAPFTLPANQGSIAFNGRPITITGAGPAGADLVTQIITRQSTTQVTLADAASTTVAAANWTFPNWSRAIQAQGSSGVSFRDMKITYDSNAFDGILIDMRSDSVAWSARGEISNCVVGGEAGDFSDATTTAASACRAYALVHLCGMGEHFRADEVQFGLCKVAVRGMYDNNADDALFTGCHFNNCIEAAVTNPGRFWQFEKCSSQGSAFGGPRMGPIFKSDGPKTLQSVLRLTDFSGWDFGQDRNESTGASITNGSTTVTITGWAAIGTYTEDMFWKDRVAVIKGAGVAGADLKTRIAKRLSSTQFQLVTAASTTVSNVAWNVADGGLIYTKSGYNWDIKIDGLMTWLGPSPEIEMLGTGKLKIEDWWNNRNFRADIVGWGEAIRFGNPATDLVTIELENLGFGSSNQQPGIDTSIANFAGHDIRQIRAVSFAHNFERLDANRHTSLLSFTSVAGATPTTAAHAGQTLSNLGAWGNDEIGYITCDTGAGGATAGQLIDVTFARAWPSLFTAIANSGQGAFSIILTPLELSDGNSRGVNSAAAAAYAKCDNANNNGWTLGIGNAVTGAKSLGWSYRIVRT